MKKLLVDPDIRKAKTLAKEFYTDDAFFEKSKDQLFARSWQYIEDANSIAEPGQYQPISLMDGFLNEPLLLTHDLKGGQYCLSNICTHRGAMLAEEAGQGRLLSCRYHGRCFRLDGSFKSMPAFEQTLNFPSPQDDLPKLPLHNWNGLLFSSIDPMTPFDDWMATINKRLSHLPLDTLEYDAATSKNYEVKAHWALYCDNYLEGFHIPFVHPALNDALEMEEYITETFDWGVLQLGIGEEGQACFEAPPGHPDYNKKVYAYFYWLFPNIMLNVYPWGISFNLIMPQTKNRTKVLFRNYRFKDSPHKVTDERMDETEMEDEEVVESVQLGINSRLYQYGRFSPKMEAGVHHFHYLLARHMSG